MVNINFYGFIYGLAIFSGFSYLIGFWIPFRFNFIEHIDLTSILKISAFSIIPVLVSMLIGAGTGSLAAFFRTRTNLSSQFEQTEYLKTPKLETIFIYIVKVFTLGIGIASLPFIFSSNLIERLIGAYPIASIIGVVYLSKNPGIFQALPISVRAVVITVICLLPTAAILHGYSLGQDVFNDKSQGYLLAETEHCSSDDEHKFRYLAASGDKILTMSLEDKSICITSDKSFRLVRHNSNAVPVATSFRHIIDKYKTLPPIRYFY